MDNKIAYINHYNKIIEAMSQEKFSNLPDSEVEILFSELLQCLPNNGKLYKYRNFLNNKHSFDYTYRSLAEGYIWFADAKTMNDKVDVTLNVDLSKEKIRLEKFFEEHKEELLIKWLKEFFRINKISSYLLDDNFHEIINCYTKEGRVVKSRIRDLLRSNGVSYKQIDITLKNVATFVEQRCVEYEPYANALVNKFISTAHKTREDLKLFCIAEKPTIESMWAYYGNDSNGFCIEYDFTKAVKYGCNIKKILLNLFKVEYRKKKPSYSMVDILEELVSNHSIDIENKTKINKNIFAQMLIKNSDWKHEQEWRIVANLPFNQFNIDLVSAIYIDESMINTPKAKKLICLSKQKGWKIIERKLSITKSSFVYKNIEY
ncbi:MAG: DUF2971 domain-containing protein [Clostridiales bacterium]|nr:DUF2971 domain-containing protein [Clostridiales bacterium]